MKIRVLVSLLLFLLSSTDAWSAAQQPKEDLAPTFPRPAVWINSSPLNKSIFNNKVTLVYFWDYTSANCLRDISFIRKWQLAYKDSGFQVIAVHSPEFDFAKQARYVESAVHRYKINFPVVLDNHFELWNAYQIVAWPSKVLVGPRGNILSKQAGEGQYQKTESEIRAAISDLNPGMLLGFPVVDEEPAGYDPETCGPMTGETYIGYKRGHWWGAEVANRSWTRPNETTIFKDRGERVHRGFFLHGLWSNHDDYFEHARETESLSDYIGLLYFGSKVYAVLGKSPMNQDAQVYVTRDNEAVPEAKRGRDLVLDPDGKTFVSVQEPRLYELIQNEDDGEHEIKLWTKNEGVTVSSLSFANYCLAQIESA